MWGQQRTPCDPQRSVWDIIARLAQEAEQQAQPSPVLNHRPPRGPLTAEQAHTVMQTHRECDRGRCGQKAAAWAVLVAAGRIVPRPANGQLAPGVA